MYPDRAVCKTTGKEYEVIGFDQGLRKVCLLIDGAPHWDDTDKYTYTF